jgi:hypothetical protein
MENGQPAGPETGTGGIDWRHVDYYYVAREGLSLVATIFARAYVAQLDALEQMPTASRLAILATVVVAASVLVRGAVWIVRRTVAEAVDRQCGRRRL